MTIRVKLFAVLRDLAGAAESSLDLPDGTTVAGAIRAVGERYPATAKALPRAAAAVNMTRVATNEVLRDGDELALLPPVSGG